MESINPFDTFLVISLVNACVLMNITFTLFQIQATFNPMVMTFPLYNVLHKDKNVHYVKHVPGNAIDTGISKDSLLEGKSNILAAFRFLSSQKIDNANTVRRQVK